MAKNALQKIEDHEKLCRIMQKQTFEQIKEMRERIKRIEYMIVAGMGSIILALVMNLLKIQKKKKNQLILKKKWKEMNHVSAAQEKNTNIVMALYKK